MKQLSLLNWLQTNPPKHVSFYNVDKDILELTDKLYRRRIIYKGRNKSPYHILTRMRCTYLVSTYGTPSKEVKHG
jgi:RNase P/RNase MRP subunit p30